MYTDGPPSPKNSMEQALKMNECEDVQGWALIGEVDPTVVYSLATGFSRKRPLDFHWRQRQHHYTGMGKGAMRD